MSEIESSGQSGGQPEDSQLPLFPADILARVKVWPGSEEARQMTVGSGLKCCASCVPSGPLGLLVRTLLGTSLWDSPVCRLIWRGRGMKAGRLLYRLVPLVLSIDETGFLLWRTPHANIWKNASTVQERLQGGHTVNLQDQVRFWPTPTVTGNNNRLGISKKAGTGLATAARLWPTPTATERSGNNPATGRGAGLSKTVKEAETVRWWPTPTRDHYSRRTRYAQGGFPLSMAVRLWPTPRASEWKGSGPKGSKNQKYRLKKRYLDGTVLEGQPDGAGGKLNPVWVEWLMGFPPGWTDISTSEGLRLSATQSSRSKSTPSSGPSH